MSGEPLMIYGSCHVSGLLAVMPRLVQAPFSAGKGLVLPILMFLFAGHALCDFPWQGQYISDQKGADPVVMLAHCFIHMGMVLVITGSVWCALAELVIHYATDYAKCSGWINFNQDQAIHYGCKILWAILTVL